MKSSIRYILLIIISFILLFNLTYAERIYVSRLSKVDYQVLQSKYSYDCIPSSIATIYNYLGYKHNGVYSIRKSITPNDGLIYADDMVDYLYTIDIWFNTRVVFDENDLIRYLNDKFIILALIDTQYINSNDKGYGNNFLHAVTITGYYRDDEVLYFEILDPYIKGVRYYNGKELIKAIKSNWSSIGIFLRKENMIGNVFK